MLFFHSAQTDPTPSRIPPRPHHPLAPRNPHGDFRNPDPGRRAVEKGSWLVGWLICKFHSPEKETPRGARASQTFDMLIINVILRGMSVGWSSTATLRSFSGFEVVTELKQTHRSEIYYQGVQCCWLRYFGR